MANETKKPIAGDSKKKPAMIFPRFITLKNGRILDAHDYGHKGWPIPVKSTK